MVFFDFLHRLLRLPYKLNYQKHGFNKRAAVTIVFIHGIGNTLHSWDEIVKALPGNVQAISVDLLGFGKSPKPNKVIYNSITQARAVRWTLLRAGITQRVVVVGHSMGALVAVELAKKYPAWVQKLVLCSPPFYSFDNSPSLIVRRDNILREIYRAAGKKPQQLEKLLGFGLKTGLANKSMNVSAETMAPYLAALEASIINQTTTDDLAKISVPVKIFYGLLDPLVIGSNISKLARCNANISVSKLVAGHEVVGLYASSVSDFIRSEFAIGS